MRDFGSSLLESRREGSRLVVVEGLSDESGQQGRSRGEETLAIFEHRRRNMVKHGGSR
jgi:hypothetical protein